MHKAPPPPGSALGPMYEAFVNFPTDPALASTHYDRLTKQIAAFQDTLAEDEEVGARLTHFGRDVTIAIERLSYENPGLLIFHGRANEGRVTLLQHFTQVNVLLIAMKAKPGTTAHRIGFAPSKPQEK